MGAVEQLGPNEAVCKPGCSGGQEAGRGLWLRSATYSPGVSRGDLRGAVCLHWASVSSPVKQDSIYLLTGCGEA